MTDKQIKLLELFKEIDKICKDNDIEYYLAGGTLLGAVRHRGYIPWDDDMDIMMTRANWERFVVACKTQMREDRKLECPDLDREYCNMFSRYVDKTSTAIHSSQVFFKDVAGFVIDILILDPIPDGEEAYKKHLEDIMLYSDLIVPTAVYSYRWGANRFRYPYYRALMKVIGRDKVYEKLEKRMFSYPEEKCSRYAMRWGGIPFSFSKEMFTGVKYMRFEDLDTEVPITSAAYLTWHYGDEWMFIPPHAEHESHDAIYSMIHNYEPVRAEIQSLVDGEKVMKSYRKRKYSILRSMKNFHALLDENRSLKAESVSYSLNKHFSQIKPQLMELKAKGDYVALFQQFSEYFKNQLSADVIGREDFANARRFHNPIYIELADDEILYLAVETLINVEKISKAMRFMDVVEICSGRKHKKFDEFRKDVWAFREAVTKFELKEYGESLKTSVALYERYPRCISYIKFFIRNLQIDGIEKNKDRIQALVNTGREIFPQEGEFLKYDADLLMLSDKISALEEYINAYMTTTNGIVHLEIYDTIVENMQSFALMIDTVSNEDSAKAVSYIDAALELIPFNAQLFKIKCDLFKKLIGNDKTLFFKYAKILDSYVKLPRCSEEVKKELVNFYKSYVNDEYIASAFVEAALLDETTYVLDLNKRREMDSKLEGEKKNWNLKFIAYDLSCLGEHKESHMILKSIAVNTKDELLKCFTVKAILSSIYHYEKNGRWLRNAYHNDLSDDISVSEWIEIYPTVRDAIDFYNLIGVLPTDGIEYIERFGVLSFDSEWTYSILKRFARLCSKCARNLFETDEVYIYDEESTELVGLESIEDQVDKMPKQIDSFAYDSSNSDQEEYYTGDDVMPVNERKGSKTGNKRL